MLIHTEDGRGAALARLAWALYDFANSAYVLVVIAFAFPLFFHQVLAESSPKADLYWGMAIGCSVISAGIVAPFVGAYADAHGSHRMCFRISAAAAIVGTFALQFLERGQLWQGFTLFVLTNASFNLSLVMYDVYLSRVAGGRLALTSGVAWGVGYLGGIGCLAVVYPWVDGLDAGNIWAFRKILGITGVWYLVFSIPILITMPAFPRRAVDARQRGSAAALREMFANWREYRHLFAFFIGYYLVTDATGTLTNFASLFARQSLGFSISRIALLLLTVQLIAIPATIVSGYIAARRGPKIVVLWGAAGWIIVCLCMSSGASHALVYVAIPIMGLVVGSTYSAARTWLSTLAPTGRIGQVFGMNAFSGRIAETVAPMLFGAVSATSGSQRLAVLSMLPFLASGLFLFLQVRTNNRTTPALTGEE